MSTLHSLTISPSAPDLANGARQQFTLTGTGADNSPVTVPVDAARWTVDQPSLGTVDQDGLFTAAPAGAGVGQVTAAAGGRQAMASIGVSELTKTLARWTMRPIGRCRTTPAGAEINGATGLSGLEASYPPARRH